MWNKTDLLQIEFHLYVDGRCFALGRCVESTAPTVLFVTVLSCNLKDSHIGPQQLAQPARSVFSNLLSTLSTIL